MLGRWKLLITIDDKERCNSVPGESPTWCNSSTYAISDFNPTLWTFSLGRRSSFIWYEEIPAERKGLWGLETPYDYKLIQAGLFRGSIYPQKEKAMSNIGRYSSPLSVKKTPQSQPIPNTDQVKNAAGGYVYKVSPLTALNRFLVLGTEGGTYYTTEQKLTVDNTKNVIECIKNNGLEAVRMIVDISTGGRAHKNDPAIFALALACTYGDEKTRCAAHDAIPMVCRIGTHLFHFMQAIQDIKGKWGRGLRRGVANFYTGRDTENLAMQLIKYRQRDGWTHKDVISLSHPSTKDDEKNALIAYAIGKIDDMEVEWTDDDGLIGAYERAKSLKDEPADVKLACKLIRDFNLPREALPTVLLNSVDVWNALLEDMPITAMIRNLGKMTNVGLLKTSLDTRVKKVVDALTDEEVLKKGRVHPMSMLMALKTYEQGHGNKGKLEWKPVRAILDALDEGFYKAFASVEPTNQNWLLALDVSGSMGSEIGETGLSCREAAAAMALVTARVEPNYEIVGFTAGGIKKVRYSWTEITPLKISPKWNLAKVTEYMAGLDFGATNCALPMLYATKNELDVDTFVIYTDNETWAGEVHPSQALKDYRKQFNPEAKAVAVAMTATEYSVFDEGDAGCLNVAGFDASAPQVISEFSQGNI